MEQIKKNLGVGCMRLPMRDGEVNVSNAASVRKPARSTSISGNCLKM